MKRLHGCIIASTRLICIKGVLHSMLGPDLVGLTVALLLLNHGIKRKF